MAVALATFVQNTWDTVYNHLQTGTYALTTNNIYSAYNDKLATTVGYPLVIIQPPIISRQKITLDGELQEAMGNILIEVYHTSAQNVKVLFDELHQSLWTGRSVFHAVNMYRVSIDTGDYDVYTEGRKKKHVMSLNFNFVYVGRS